MTRRYTGGCPGKPAPALHRPDAPAGSAVPGLRQFPRLAQWPVSDQAGSCATRHISTVQTCLLPPTAPPMPMRNMHAATLCAATHHADRLPETGRRVDYTRKAGRNSQRTTRFASMTVVRMEVPCCGGLEQAVRRALQDIGKFLPWHVVTLSIDGRVLRLIRQIQTIYPIYKETFLCVRQRPTRRGLLLRADARLRVFLRR